MKILSKIAVLTLLAGLAGCSFFKSRIQPYPVGIMFPVAESARLPIEGKITGLIRKSGDCIFFSTEQGKVVCLDVVRRSILWTFDASKTLADPPCVDAERVYVNDPAGTLFCLDWKGTLLWRKNFGDKLSTHPAADGGRVFLSLERGEILAVDGRTGEQIWIYKAPETARAGPVFWNGAALFGCDGGKILLFDAFRKTAWITESGLKVLDNFFLDGDILFFSTGEGEICRLNLRKWRISWRVRTGGNVLSPPLSYKKRLYVISSNSVLACLDKSGGDILWWRIIPARTPFHLERSGEQILVSSLSPLLHGYDAVSGKPLGVWQAPEEALFMTNPLWSGPDIMAGLHSDATGAGALVFLQKELRITIVPSLPSPQTPGQEIVASVEALGFHQPLFEFYLKNGMKKDVVQKESAKNIWRWFPEKEGIYAVAVKVRDEKHTLETEIPFEIKK